jgi:hypothetical protein
VTIFSNLIKTASCEVIDENPETLAIIGS